MLPMQVVENGINCKYIHRIKHLKLRQAVRAEEKYTSGFAAFKTYLDERKGSNA